MKFLKKSVFVLLVSLQLAFSYRHTAFHDRMGSDDEFLDEFESDKRMYHGEAFPYHKNEFQREINLAKRSGVTAIENMEASALTAHNNARSRHENTGLLSYNKELEKHALAYAMKLARTNTFDHDTAELKRYGEGENLYMSRSEVVSDICDAVFGWYNEIMEFKYEKLSKNYNVFPMPTNLGHFTQIVWADTTEVGCAGAYRLSVNQRQGKYDTYVVCRYKNPGNVLFEFPQNVHQLKASSPGYFSSFKEVCGAGCVDKKPDCASKKNDCNRAFFGPYIKKDCPKTCNMC